MAEAFLGCAGQVQLPEGYLKQVFKLVAFYLDYYKHNFNITVLTCTCTHHCSMQNASDLYFSSLC